MPEGPLIISGSARKEGATTQLIQHVFENTPHTLIELMDVTIAPYSYTADYNATDGFLPIVDAMLQHQVIVFATPVYWYAMGGLMKNFFDRLTDIVTIQKDKGRQLKGKTVLLLSAGADPELPEGFEVPFSRTAEYLHMMYKGFLYQSINYPKNEAVMSAAIQHFKHQLYEGL